MTNPSLYQRDRELEIPLAILRLSSALFLAVWAFDKILNNQHAIKTVSKFYVSVDSTSIILALGVVQLIVVLAFAGGLFKTISYGAVFLMHAVSTVASYQLYMTPLARPNILFWAAIPVLAGLLLLFVLRHRDNFLTMGK